MMLYDEIKTSYEGMFYKFVESDFNCFVYTGPNGDGDLMKMVGRMVQIRKKAGVAGSDKVLIRHLDGDLTCHENQSYIKVTNEDDLKLLEEAFKDVTQDSNEEEYTCLNKVPATGFIVEGLPESEETLSFSMTTSTNPNPTTEKEE